MTTPGAGHEFPPVDVSWTKRDVLLFAASIGCTVDELHFLYELHPHFQPFPTYPIVLPFKQTSADVIDFYARTRASSPPSLPGLPKLDPTRLVDGQRYMTFQKPLPTTSSSSAAGFGIRSKILGVYDKGKPGTVLETEQALVDKATGQVHSTVVGSAFYVGQGGWGGPKGEKAAEFPPPEGRAPDAVQELQTSLETPHLYRLNGDYNPLHATPEPGRRMGFGGAIVHGLYSWNVAAVVVVRAFAGSEPARLRGFGGRFASPVRPGERLRVEMWRMGAADGDGWEEVRFLVRVVGGKVCLSNGRAVVRVVEGGKGEKSKL